MVVGLLLLGADFGYTDRGGHGYRGHRGHHHHHRGFHHGHRGPGVRIGIGVGLGTFWEPYWPHYAYAPVVVAPPPVVVQPSLPPPQYWYYCDSAQAYYPYVAQCPEGWRAVTPTLQ
jgi:hypothetical protein